MDIEFCVTYSLNFGDNCIIFLSILLNLLYNLMKFLIVKHLEEMNHIVFLEFIPAFGHNAIVFQMCC